MNIRFFTGLGLILFLFSTMISPVFAADSFSDLSSSHPNYTAIMDLKTRGIIGGYPDGTFKPDQNVNRVEALKIILLAAEIEIDNTQTQSQFSDTKAGEWYSPILNEAVAQKIVSGYPDGTFKPTQTVNLVEALKIGQLSFGINMESIKVTEAPYADTPADAWYAKYVQFAKDNALIDADSNNKVYPDQPMTRAKLCELIYRLLNSDPVVDNTKPKDEEPVVDDTVTDITLNVSILKYIYSPKDMTVGLGSTVKWTNTADINHTVTSDTAKFNSGTMEPGDTYSYQFNEVGTFTYRCNFHDTMTGTIIVKPANEVPTI